MRKASAIQKRFPLWKPFLYCCHSRDLSKQSSGWSEAEAGVCEEQSEELATLVVVTSLRSETGTTPSLAEGVFILRLSPRGKRAEFGLKRSGSRRM